MEKVTAITVECACGYSQHLKPTKDGIFPCFLAYATSRKKSSKIKIEIDWTCDHCEKHNDVDLGHKY